ncbi:MAG: hypothetical protein IBX64_05275 [Actinobacteria bacterium]|nr:hypothetical protein [Actinomycetota bacterium]
MSVKIKRISVLLLVALFLTGLVAGAYAASTNAAKEENPKVTVGKNWRASGVVKPNGMPEPMKNLKDTADTATAEKAIEQRSSSSNVAPVGPGKNSK